jgi:hypothetical protein
MFSNQNKQMYDDLMTATVHTSADMSAKLVVVQDDTAVKVECDRPSLIMKRDEAGLLITLPLAKAERRKSMSGQLPGYLSELLHIYDSRGEKQIYRIINELESGTDEILLDEEISRVSWLAETSRPAPASEPETETPPQPQSSTRRSSNFVNEETEDPPRHAQPHLETREFETPIRAAGSISANHSGGIHPPPPPFRALPEVLNHAVEAPDYWKVLEHVRKQAASAGSDLRDISNPTTDDITCYFASLTLHSTSFDPADYPSCFGDDFWLSKFRIGAAGELFVSLPDLVRLSNIC